MRFLNKQLTFIIALVFVSITFVYGERWSRQLTQNSPTTANDWVPIRNGKSISFGEDLTAAAQSQYQFFAEPANNRFNLQQQHPGGSEINSFASQNFQFFNPQKQRTVQNFGGSIVNKPNAEPLIQSPPPFQYMQEIQRGPHVHHYQSQPIPKSLQNFPQSQQTVPPFQQLSGQARVPQFQTLPPPPQFQSAQVPQFQSLQGEQQQQQQPQPQSEENVQLLYVPYDSLYQQQNQQPNGAFNEAKSNRFSILNQPVSASLINDFYSQNEVQEFPAKPATTKRPITTKRPTIAPFTSSVNPTTPFETNSKPKPHQPPLSMFVAIDKVNGKVTEADVLQTLKNSNSIDVMDTITKNAPKVFIGPSGMTAPTGYSKFDLPYLSSIEGTRYERKIEQLPFFVAPLSYRTPPGFSKIPLPAPHVGSVVVNQPPNTIESNEDSGFTQDNYYTKQPASSTVQLTQSNLDPSQKTQKVTLTSGFNYSPSGNVQLIRNEYTFPTLSPTRGTSPAIENQSRSVYTTPRSTFAQTASQSTAQTPLTKVAYKQIEEKRNYGHSTLTPTTTRTPVTRTKLDHFPSSARSTARPQTTTPAFIELEEHKTINEEYYGFEKENKPTFSFKFGSEVEKPTQNFNFRGAEVEKPAQNFNFRPIPDFDFGDSDYVTTRKPRTKATTQAPVVETEKVTQYTFPSSTANPTASFEYTPTVSAVENTEEYGQVNGGSVGNFFEYRSSPRPTTQDFTFNRFNFGSEQSYTPDNSYTPQQYVQETLNTEQEQSEVNENNEETTDNPTYNLPSELPSISPQLPGWVNSLMEDKWMQNTNITEEVPTTTTTTTTTRRPINRGSRRPSTTSYRSTATSTETTAERRPVTSRRRPTTYSSRNSIATTESSFPSRSTAVRGSKVKYNATSEERSRFRTRNRVPVTIKKQAEDINYQRDVLNQNYPSIRPVAVETSTEKVVEETPIVQYQSEVPTAQHILNDYNTPLESVEVIPLGGNLNYTQETSENYYTPNHRPLFYDNTIETSTFTTTSTTQETPLPVNHKYSNNFVGLQEPMQVPHHRPAIHRLKSNFKNRNIDSFYNSNSQDSTTQKPKHEDDEILFTVPTTQATTRLTTTEAAPTDSPIPRRTSFPRRRLVQTTTDTPTASPDSDTTESYGGRTRGRKENVVVVKKVRTRTRPTTTTTETPETTRRTVAVRSRSSLNRNSPRESVRERGSDNTVEEKENKVKPRFRIRENTSRFRLETQESQWSSRYNQNSFQPIDEEKSKSLKATEVDDEQEIVTASIDDEKEIYLFNVTASVVPTKPSEKIADVDEKINMISTTEKDVHGKRIKNDDELSSSFEKFVKDVLEDIEDEGKSEAKTEKKAIANEKKTNSRRGVWKKIKVRPADGFETAETQYVGSRLYNSVSDNEKTEGEKQITFEEQPSEKPETTTVKYIEIEPTEIVSTKDTPLEHVFSETTTIEPEIEERKPGMFDEARKALTELFSSEDDSDDAVNMEEADDRLEALSESTTSTQLPLIEDTTTNVPPTASVEISTTIKSEESIVNKSSKQMKTSTSQKVTGEICYRGRCIKTDEQ